MKTVFFDIDTQIDFLFPAGALYVRGAERLLPTLAKLNRYAAEHSIPVVSTMDAHTEDDPEFKDWHPHCIAGEQGQRKPAELLLERRVVVPPVPADVRINGAQQIIVEKRKLDLFSNPNLPRLLEELGADSYVVYGVVTEYCVACALRGLQATNKPVTLITDAIRSIDEGAAARVLAEFTSAGGRLLTAAEAVR
ncbi:MAG: cysteine hydrolase family protein [Rhodospirillales bacterium]